MQKARLDLNLLETRLKSKLSGRLREKSGCELFISGLRFRCKLILPLRTDVVQFWQLVTDKSRHVEARGCGIELRRTSRGRRAGLNWVASTLAQHLKLLKLAEVSEVGILRSDGKSGGRRGRVRRERGRTCNSGGSTLRNSFGTFASGALLYNGLKLSNQGL